MSSADGLLFDPDDVKMTLHVLERYLQRRNVTNAELRDAEAGLRRLLARAERTQRTKYGAPPTGNPKRGNARTYRVGEYVLILDHDHEHLITFYREFEPGARVRRHTTPLHRGGRRRGRPRPEHVPDDPTIPGDDDDD